MTLTLHWPFSCSSKYNKVGATCPALLPPALSTTRGEVASSGADAAAVGLGKKLASPLCDAVRAAAVVAGAVAVAPAVAVAAAAAGAAAVVASLAAAATPAVAAAGLQDRPAWETGLEAERMCATFDV